MYLNGYQIYQLAINAGLDCAEPAKEDLTDSSYYITNSEDLISDARWKLHTDQPFDLMYSVDYPEDGYFVLAEEKEEK